MKLFEFWKRRIGYQFGAAVIAMALPAFAAGPQPQWTWEAGAQTNNGAITIKSTNGSTTYSGTQNPTGAVVKINQNAVTQPPTIVLQATASLPIKAIGDACTASTTGTAPNQSAGEGTAITADRTSLLSCQSGLWTATGTVVGRYLFQVTGVGGWYVGTGRYSAASGKFSGSLTCDPMTRSIYCGRSGNYWCAADANCVYAVAFVGGGSDGHSDAGVGSSNLYVTGVAGLSVNTVTQQW